MDPEYITSTAWSGVGDFLTFLWLFLLFQVSFGFNFLMAHAIIPSLTETGHLPQSVNKARRVFYVGAVGSLAAVVFVVSRAFVEAQFLRDVWGRFWI